MNVYLVVIIYLITFYSEQGANMIYPFTQFTALSIINWYYITHNKFYKNGFVIYFLSFITDSKTQKV